MNDRFWEIVEQADEQGGDDPDIRDQVFAELMIAEFMDVVKSTANELNEHYFKQGASEEEVLMRVNGALAVLGHIRARFKD